MVAGDFPQWNILGMVTIPAITICFGAPAFPEPTLSIQQQVAKKYCISLHGSSSKYWTVVFSILWKAVLEIPTGESSAICHIAPMTSCPQIESWRVLFVRLLPIPAMQQLQSCPAWFYTLAIQLVFLGTGIPITQQQVTWKTFLSPFTQV